MPYPGNNAIDIERTEHHLHAVCLVAPNLAAGITVTATNGGGSWTLGAASATILTTSATMWTDIHYVHVSAISTAGNYQLNLYANGVLICEIPLYKQNVTADNWSRVNICTPMIAPGSVITAKLASATDDGETCVVKVNYHTYPIGIRG
jgi:hypothetical protein